MAIAAPPQPSAAGLWKTIDDKTGKARGLVRIYTDNGRLFGKIESSFDPAEANQHCDKCTGERKNQPVIGLIILRDMELHGGEYVGGDILDPDSGSIYRCKMRLIEGGSKLLVRGFLGVSFFGRDQVWLRAQ